MRPERGLDLVVGELGRVSMPMKADAWDGLALSTQTQTGQIVVWQGEVIFGAADYAACGAAGMEPTFTNLPDEGDPVPFLLGQAAVSTLWDETERSYQSFRMWEFAQRWRRGEVSGPCANLRTVAKQEDIAKAYKVSRRMITHTGRVYGQDSSADQSLQMAVADRRIRMSDASAVVDEPADVQRQAIALVQKERARLVRKAVEQIYEDREQAAAEAARGENEVKAEEAGVILDAFTVAELRERIPPKSVNLIITFPPVDNKAMEGLKDLPGFADHALKDNGALALMVNGANLLRVANCLPERHGDLRFITELDYRYGPPPSKLGRGHGMKLCRRALLIFGKAGFRLADGEDDIQLPPRDGEGRPDWDPRLDLGARLIMDRFAGPASVVCDPIMGDRADIAAAAIVAGHRFIGAVSFA